MTRDESKPALGWATCPQCGEVLTYPARYWEADMALSIHKDVNHAR